MSTPPPQASPARRPLGRIAIIGGGAVIALIAIIAGYIWISGGSGTAHGPLAVATLPANPDATTFALGTGTQAMFTMTEVHFGSPSTVVGKTDQVSGELQVDFKDPQKSTVGQIRVDVSTLATDSAFRDRTMRSQILQTDQPANQYALFTPQAPVGLQSTPITAGQTVTFQLPGSLLLHGVTRPETFAVSVTLTSMSQLTGTAKTTVKYADFGMTIPNVPNVANVSQDVQLELDFNAQKK